MKYAKDYMVCDIPFTPDQETFLVNEISLQFKPVYSLASDIVVKTCQDAYSVIKPFYEEVMNIQEQFAVIYLNNQHKVIGVYILSTGGITSTVVDIRLILSVALKCLATSIIIVHNHPSGTLKASVNDKAISRRIAESAKLMDIELLDHLIITGSGNYISFSELGYLN